MSSTADGAKSAFVITVSARALFDLEEAHAIFEKDGTAAYGAHMLEHENAPLKAGPALPLVRKLLDLNKRLPEGATPVDVVLLSRNSATTAMRIFKSIKHHNLAIERSLFTDGEPTANYIEALDAKLFLSSNPKQVVRAIDAGIAAATIMPRKGHNGEAIERDDIRIALDGDAVIFSDESEKAFRDGGLEGFRKYEETHEGRPMENGPFRGFLEALHGLQQALGPEDRSIRTALVTARGVPTHSRALETLRHWGVRVDEAMFLAGRPKGPFLKAFGADIFFDDSVNNIQNAMEHVASAHVPSGARNEAGADEHNFTGGGQELERPRLASVPVVPVDPAGGERPARRRRQPS